MKQKKRGFTLVELVIVIAVIAILAGVMIAVFANVVNKAEKSRQEQEMKQAELEQKSDDIIKKLENADWLSWEDIEVAIAEGLKGIDAGASSEDVSKAVDAAIKKYADSLGSGNTGVTEEQIKYIIENSLQGQLTATQVEAIVKKYQASSTVTLSASQPDQGSGKCQFSDGYSGSIDCKGDFRWCRNLGNGSCKTGNFRFEQFRTDGRGSKSNRY